MDNQQERLFNLGWLVSAIESEGGFCFVKTGKGVHTGRYTPMITVANTDYYFMNMVVKCLKELNIPYYIYRRHKPRSTYSKKDSWDLIIRGYQRCGKALSILLPYLRSDKIQQALLMKDIVDRRIKLGNHYEYGSYEDEAYLQMKKLNKIPRDYTQDIITGEDIVRADTKVSELIGNN